MAKGQTRHDRASLNDVEAVVGTPGPGEGAGHEQARDSQDPSEYATGLEDAGNGIRSTPEPFCPPRIMPCRVVRASYTDEVITVYQAYSSPIADAAITAGTFVAPFKRERMTWIKPSFLWMMYRSGWGTKPGQERVLAITITREGFEWALAHAALSHFDDRLHGSEDEWRAQKQVSPVRAQWDPERSLTSAALTHRAIQVGLGGEAVRCYVTEWITGITDVSGLAAQIHAEVSAGHLDAAQAALPVERVYPLPEHIRARLGADPVLAPS